MDNVINATTDYIMKWVIIISCGVFGVLLMDQLMPFINLTFMQHHPISEAVEAFLWVFFGGLMFTGFGWLFQKRAIKFVKKFSDRVEKQLTIESSEGLLGGAFGVIVGLIIANLFALTLWNIPYIGKYLPIVFSVFAAYVGGSVCKTKNYEMLNVFKKIGTLKAELADKYLGVNKIVDTSVIIDGRIEEIFKTGFIDGTLVVPHFVIKELQLLADSTDEIKRAKGRRALDTLNRLRVDYANMIRIDDTDYHNIREVDLKLLRLAQEIGGKILTVDYNLNKVAMLHGIFVLNINELAGAIKSNVANGEVLTVNLVKEGKEPGQAVSYLDDGTMIIVEDGKNYIGKSIEVLVHSVFQTAAGRLIFARTKQTSNLE
ncbi:MAG: PIN domain-containing protein [Negativicutes bacterium]